LPGVSLDTISGLNPELQRAFQKSAQAERRPITHMENRKGDIQNKVSLLGEILSRIDNVKNIIPELNSPIAIREIAFSSTDDKIITGTADKNLVELGAHQIEVERLASPATALSNRFPDKNQTKIGTGYFAFTTASGDTKEVFVDDENATLEGLAKIINSAKLGLKAAVIRDQSDSEYPYRLLLSTDKSGADHDVEYPIFYFIGGEEEFYLEEETPGTNALIRYEGFEIESPTNEIRDLIPGVTLNLKGLTDAGKPENVSIDQDIPQTTVKIKDLVENLNQVLTFIQEQNKMDENTNSRNTLGGDYGIRMAETRIRNALQRSVRYDLGGDIVGLWDLGIQFNKKGTLDFDEKKFEDALNRNFEGTVALLTGDGSRLGVIPRLKQVLDSISDPISGVLSIQKKNYGQQITRLNRDMERKEEIVAKKTQRLKEQLLKAQNALNSIQRQSASIPMSQGIIPQQLLMR